MKRTLNVRFLAILAIGVVVLGVGIHVLHIFQVSRNATKMLAQAEQAEADKNYPEAIKRREQYVNLNPYDAAALAKLGLLMGREENLKSITDFRRTISVLERAVNRAPEENEARRRLAVIHLDMGYIYRSNGVLFDDPFKEARGHFEILANTFKDDGIIEGYLGQCEAALRSPDRAMAWFEKAIKHSPQEVGNYTRLAELLLGRTANKPQAAARLDRNRADALMDLHEVKTGVVANNPKSALAYLARAQYARATLSTLDVQKDALQRKKIYEGALQDTRTAYKLDPANLAVLDLSAKFALEEGELAVAAAHFQRMTELFPERLIGYRSLADLEVANQKPKEAIATLERGMKALPKEPELKWMYAKALLLTSDFEGSRKILAELREENYSTSRIDHLEGMILFAQQKWTEALAVLEKNAPIFLKPPANPELEGDERRLDRLGIAKHEYYAIAECYDRLRNTDQQYIALRKAADIVTTEVVFDQQVRLKLAQTLNELGRATDADQELRKLGLNLVGLESTIEYLKVAITNQLKLPSDQRHWKELDETVDKILAVNNMLPAAVFLKVEILIGQDKSDEARKFLEDRIKAAPKQAMYWVVLCEILDRQGKSAEIPAVLDRAKKEAGDQFELRLLQIRLAASSKSADYKKQLDPLLVGIDKLTAAQRTQIYETMGKAHFLAGRRAEAREAILRWGDAEKQTVNPYLILFDIASADNNEADLDGLIADVRKLEGASGTTAPFMEAIRLFRRGRRPELPAKEKQEVLAKSAEILEDIVKKRPTWMLATQSLGLVRDVQGQTDEAIRHLLRAINDLGSRDMLVVQRTAQLLGERRRFTQADEILKKFQERGPLTGDLSRLASQVSAEVQDFDRAVALARKNATSANANEFDKSWYPQLLVSNAQRLGNENRIVDAKRVLQEAIEASRKALASDPKLPDVWFALVKALMLDGQRSEAVTAVTDASRALKTLPNQSRADMLLAACYQFIGKVDEAVKIYKAMIERDPKDAIALQSLATVYMQKKQLAEATPLIEQLLTMTSAPNESDWARRAKALIVAAPGNYTAMQDAFKLLDNPSSAKSNEDLRMKAKFLSLMLNRDKRREAASIFENLVRAENQPGDIFLLAQLYENNNEWLKSRETFQKLMATQSSNLGIIATYTRLLIRHNELNDAQAWLTKLEQSMPQDPSTIELKARLLNARGSKEAAAEVLRTFARRDTVNGVYAGFWLEDMKQPVAAEEVFRHYVATSKIPDAILTLAAFYGRQGQTTQALDLAERSWNVNKAAALANVCVQILYSSRVRDEDCERVAQKITESIKTSSNPTELQFQLANIRSLQGRYSEAEAIFRKLWQADPNNASSLNNLAWLMAVQDNPKGAEALEAINKAIEVLGPTPEVLDTRAIAYIATGNLPLAIKDLEDAISIRPQTSMYVHLANAYLKSNRRADAAKALAEAKANGFVVENLHPLERKVYLELAKELDSQ